MRYSFLLMVLFIAACEPVDNTETPPPEVEETSPSEESAVTEDIDIKGLDQKDDVEHTSGVLIVMGTDIASLGNANIPGLWVKSRLVSEEDILVLYHPETMQKLTLKAYPSDGSTQISIDVYKALNISPADLVEIELSRP